MIWQRYNRDISTKITVSHHLSLSVVFNKFENFEFTMQPGFVLERLSNCLIETMMFGNAKRPESCFKWKSSTWGSRRAFIGHLSFTINGVGPIAKYWLKYKSSFCNFFLNSRWNSSVYFICYKFKVKTFPMCVKKIFLRIWIYGLTIKTGTPFIILILESFACSIQ